MDAARPALIDIPGIDSGTAVSLAGTGDAPPAPTGVETALPHRSDYLLAVPGIRNLVTRAVMAEDARRWDRSKTLSTRAARSGTTIGFGGGGEPDYGIRPDLAISPGLGAADQDRRGHAAASVAPGKERNKLAVRHCRIDIEVGNVMREVELARRPVALARTAREPVDEKAEIATEKLRFGGLSNSRPVAFEDDLVAAANSERAARIADLNALTSPNPDPGVTLVRRNTETEESDRDPGR